MRGRLLLASVLALTVAGCASTRKETKDAHIQHLQTQLGELRSELQYKNEEIDYLKRQLQNAKSQKTASVKDTKTKGSASNIGRMTPKNIQVALNNAGFYNGAIDGKLGKNTKKAIQEFQKANGLAVDGIAGKETCLKLKKYLD